MAIENVNTFIAVEQSLTHFNGQAWLNVTISFTYTDEFGEEQNFLFPGDAGSYFLDIYDSEERTTLVKQYAAQITRSSNVLVINMSVSDMTFSDLGTFYYVLGYVKSGYDEALRYGPFVVV